MVKKEYPFDIQGLFENLEKLFEEAQLGKNEAIQRLDAIKKLANPIFDFSASDYKRILDKELSLPVKKGIQLYKMMNGLTYLVQPTGKDKGTATAVRRIDYENITWEELLDLRGGFNTGFIMQAMKQRAEPNFEGLNMLNEHQKELYQRIKVYFGYKKKPTLQSLAMNLLSEEADGKDFSERSLYIYLDAVEKHQQRRKLAAGFDVLFYTFYSIREFNSGGTIRQSIENWDNTMRATATSIYGMQQEVFANLFKNIMPKPKEILLSQLEIPQFSNLFRPIFLDASILKSLTPKNDST